MAPDKNRTKNSNKTPTLLSARITDYSAAITELQQANNEEAEEKCLSVLLARDEVASALKERVGLTSETLRNLKQLDAQLRAVELVAKVGEGKFKEWREEFHPTSESWWWFLDEQPVPTLTWRTYIARVIAWVLVVVSLGYIVEVLKRALFGRTDVLSVVLAGLISVLTGATLVKTTWHLVGRTQPDRKQASKLKLEYLLAASLTIIAIGLYLITPKIGSYLNEQGVQAYDRRDFTSAIRYFERALSLNPDHAEVLYNLGTAYEGIKDYDKAIDAYGRARTANSNLVHAYNNLARLYLVRKDYRTALDLMALVTAKPEHFKPIDRYAIYKNLGWAYWGQNNLPQAQNTLTIALAINCNGAEAHYLLGKVYESLGKPNEAAQHMKRCIESFNVNNNQPLEQDWRAQCSQVGGVTK